MTKELLWEQKWRSFRRSSPQSGPEYSRNTNNQPILREEESLLRELTDQELKKAQEYIGNLRTDDLSFENIFGDKKRIVIPFAPGPTGELSQLIEFFEEAGYKIDWENGLVTKEVETQKGTQLRKAKIGKTLGKAISLVKKKEDVYLQMRINANKLEVVINEIAKRLIAKKEKELARNLNYSERFEISKKVRNSNPDEYPELKAVHQNIEKTRAENKSITMRYLKDFGVYDPHLTSELLEKILKHWNEKGEFYRKNPKAIEGSEADYSIVITRAPIDVLRMSDFDDITSCHSPPGRKDSFGGGYYACAVAEAQGHGPIAYVVENEDIPDGMDWEADEVFYDSHRGVGSITPVSRVRIRKYVHNIDDYELAIPERRVYGRDFPNLTKEVTRFLRERQPDIVNNPPDTEEDLDDLFTRYGGSYADSTDGSLFNRFFNSREYAGDASINRDDEPDARDLEGGDTAEEFEAQCLAIDNRFDFDYWNASYNVDDNGFGEEAIVYFSAQTQLLIDEKYLTDKYEDFSYSWRELNALSYKIHDVLGDYPSLEIEVQDDAGDLVIILESHAREAESTPDGYEYFLDNIVSELEEDYEKIVHKIKHILEEEGIYKKSPYDQIRSKVLDPKLRDKLFKHFVVEDDEDGVGFHLLLRDEESFPLDISFIIKDKNAGISDGAGRRTLPARDDVAKKIFRLVNSDMYRHKFWSGIVGMIEDASRQLDLPGIEASEKTNIRMPFENFRFRMIRYPRKVGNQPWAIDMELALSLNSTQGDEDVEIALRILKFIDDNYEKIVFFANRVFREYVQSVTDLKESIDIITKTEQLINSILKESILPSEASAPSNKKITIKFEKKQK